MKTSILLPSMNRPDLLVACINQIYATTQEHDIEVIVSIDEDQESVRRVLSETPADRVIFNRKRIGALAAWNQTLANSTGEWLFPIGDDGWCQPSWLDYAIECHQKKLDGYGCVGLNDGMNLPRKDGVPIVQTTLFFDRKFAKEVFGGVIAMPTYHYSCVDLELNERASRVGKLVWCEASVVEHRHSSVSKRPFDAIDAEKTSFVQQDNELFEQRKRDNFPNDFEPII